MEDNKAEGAFIASAQESMNTGHDLVAQSHVKTPIVAEQVDLASNSQDISESANNFASSTSLHQDQEMADVQDRSFENSTPPSDLLMNPNQVTSHNLRAGPTVSTNNISSLSVIANYGSDSYDSDDDDNSNCNTNVESGVPARPLPPQPSDYRTIQQASEDSDSDSSKSSDDDSSSTSSSDSSNEANIGAKNQARGKDDSFSNEKHVRVAGETNLEDLPPIEDLQISVPENACQEMGSISSIVDLQVVVQAKANFPPLNLDTVLFLDRGRRPLGAIFDVLGQVSEPLYTVRFNSAQHIKEKDVRPGMPVFCAPHTKHTNFVFMDELLKMKGSDQGWDDSGDAPPADCIDFSDDEAERNYRRSMQSSRSNSSDWDTPPRKRVNSFERRMNERNLRKSALPPEPPRVQPRAQTPGRAPGRAQGGFRIGRGPVFPSPPHQARAEPHFTRGYCFPPPPAPAGAYNAFCLGLGAEQQRFRGPQAAPLALAYSMGFPAPPRQPYPVMLRPPALRYESAQFPNFPPCFTNPHPPQPPMRAQPYSPMFSGLPMFNPGFPPPQMHPRGNMYPVGPPQPPRGGV